FEGGIGMTEQEWLECTNPGSTLGYLQGKMSGRKLRLFVCSCVRRLWSSLGTEQSQNTVVVAERYADGLATDEDLDAAYRGAYAAAVLSEEFHSERLPEDADADETVRLMSIH